MITAPVLLTEPIIAVMSCSHLRSARALAHLFMLHAITLHATQKQTFTSRRRRSLVIPCARLSSEFVASMPVRML